MDYPNLNIMLYQNDILRVLPYGDGNVRQRSAKSQWIVDDVQGVTNDSVMSDAQLLNFTKITKYVMLITEAIDNFSVYEQTRHG